MADFLESNEQLSLPFRFPLSHSMAARWRALPEITKHKFFDDFSQSILCDDQPELALADLSVDKSEYVMLQHKFVYASRLAKHVAAVSLDSLAMAFSLYVTVRLRRQKPLRGEVELCAEWAGLIGLQHRLEVPCKAGRIDILFDSCSLIVEAKYAKDFKHALGQVLAYQYVLSKSYKCGLLLLQDEYTERSHLAELCCNSLGVKVYWYSGNGKLCMHGLKLKHERRQR